jgi:hypothetical protein
MISSNFKTICITSIILFVGISIVPADQLAWHGDSAAVENTRHAGEISRQAIFRATEKVFASRPLTQMDVAALAALTDAVAEQGSPGLSAFLTETTDNHRREVDSNITTLLLELLKTDSSDLQDYEAEIRSIVETFPDSIADRTADDSTKISPIIPIIIGGGICGMAIASCEGDAFQLFDQCLDGSWCAGGDWVDSECCTNIFNSDILNCYATCGGNLPDGDAGACCRDGSGSGHNS